MLDQPQKQLSLPNSLPGFSYNLHRQCQLAFGPGSKPCPFMQPCSKLWCTGKAQGQLVCQTRHFPWADGTGCGDGRVCHRGSCADKNATARVKVRCPPPKKTGFSQFRRHLTHAGSGFTRSR